MQRPELPWTVRRLLEWTGGFFARKEVDAPRLSAELVLAHVLGVARLKLYTDYERVIEEPQLGVYRELVKRAAEHEPIAYLTGRAWFFNLEFEVDNNVLIPRPDTETIVENVLQLARNTPGFEAPRVLDLCTGSGCIAAAIAHHLKGAVLVATELSAGAAAVARKNLSRLGLAERVAVMEGDLFEPLRQSMDAHPFDLVVSNPPYIPSGDILKLPRNVRDYEPAHALDGGPDGLAFHRRILEQAPDRLRAGGRLYIEIQFDQGPAVKELAQQNGEALEDIRLLKDFAGHERVLTARRK